MGARLATAVDWTARLSRVGLCLSVAAVAIGTARDFGFAVPLDVAIERTLAEVAPQDRLERQASAALDAEDVALARGYVELAAELNRPLSVDTLARLAAAETPGAAAWRSTRGFAQGFATGSADGPAALAGAVASDLTVIGDVRDLVGEGAKIVRGEEHSDLMIALAAAGVGLTAATVASGGAAAPAKVGVSILKAARRAGTLTADFAAHLTRTLGRAADARRVEAAALRGARAGEGAATPALRAFGGMAGELRAASAVAGPAETVRLMKFVRSGDDLADLAPFARRFGVKARAVAELTGRASLRGFRPTIRLGEMILAHLWAALLWFGGLLAGAVSNLSFRAVRFAAARV
ncbi:hypothetical protein JOD31_003109 [Methylopila capsulata]|uniref:Uncharacterized protein n=1 Tax=Methylopila capsulata TaxID=61654 RepID=A0A9W6IV00_9HYPH|nr:hypothetical protein [Methylopila capsulata]MBM7852867.1 hypothetical protein [Methylopila capsulata]GLK57076.1 hypothetical protein GCM10008170_30950 [Methylopila capsulata]